ncbi:MAG: Lrp/AsnC family transcriptional regulator [Promethearchaeia archaeon]
MTIKALIFCKVEHSAMVDVLEEMRKIPEIKKLFSLTGEYDILAEIQVETTEDLYNSFAKKIDCIKGIINTNTHVVMKEWEK